jgi:hypothetical protein
MMSHEYVPFLERVPATSVRTTLTVYPVLVLHILLKEEALCCRSRILLEMGEKIFISPQGKVSEADIHA